MGSDRRLALAMLEDARRTFVENVRDLTLDEVLFAGQGYRSILGLMKHLAGWSAVYHSYAFEPRPRHWDQTAWPHGLRDRIEPTEEYVAEILAWFERSHERWVASVAEAVDLDEPRPVHWGDTMPVADVLVLVAGHWRYHAGEINALLSLKRGQAWEWGEEVEENHLSTAGHGVRPPWMSDDEAARYAAEHGSPAP